MNEQPGEDIICFICDYGWIIVILIILALLVFFTRSYWLPLVTGEATMMHFMAVV